MIEMNMINENIDTLWKDEDEEDEDDKRLENLRRSGSSEKGGR
jgi:hypothetical protein